MKLDKNKSQTFKSANVTLSEERKIFQKTLTRNHQIIGVLTLFLSLSLVLPTEALEQKPHKSIYQLLNNEYTQKYIDALSIMESGKQYMNQERQRKEEQREIFNHFCAVYQIDNQKAYEIATYRTNNFTDPEYLATNRIPGTLIFGQTRNFDTPELGYLIYIRTLAQKPYLFGEKSQNVQTNISYQPSATNYDIIETYCTLTGLDPYLMVAIMQHETGNFTSSLYQNNNNPGGMRNASTHQYYHYSNLEQGIIENILLLSYSPLYQDVTSIETIVQLRDIYCPLGEAGNESWLPSVQENYYQAQANQIFHHQKQKIKTK